MTQTNLTRRYPRSLLSEPFFRGLDRLFEDDAFRPFSLLREDLRSGGWMPAVDIRETDDSYEFTAELPGLAKEDVSITLEDKILTLSGERKFEEAEERNSYHRVERAYGKFSRSFTLPGAVDQAKVKASFKDGLLTVSVPKAEEIKPRRIEIR